VPILRFPFTCAGDAHGTAVIWGQLLLGDGYEDEVIALTISALMKA
jgi:hypothetical protein